MLSGLITLRFIFEYDREDSYIIILVNLFLYVLFFLENDYYFCFYLMIE